VDYADRVLTHGGIQGASDIGYTDMVLSQGATDCLHWKGMPLFKTAFDFALYPLLLWEVRPRTLIELGSGTGASAVWLADLLDTFEIACPVYSMDLTAPPIKDSRIQFLEGDSRTIERVFDESRLGTAERPLLLIEDAHVNVDGVLRHFHTWTRPGDYVIVEDSPGKQEAIARFLNEVPGRYKVDTRYTDFFGRNATCAQDSIFVRV
jgi:cephalosporin hydroxylase